jgi:hypothetical protein
VVDAEQLEVGRALRARCASLRQLVFDGTGRCPEDCIPYEQLLSRDPLEPRDIDEHSLVREPFWAGRDRRVN